MCIHIHIYVYMSVYVDRERATGRFNIDLIIPTLYSCTNAERKVQRQTEREREKERHRDFHIHINMYICIYMERETHLNRIYMYI